MQGSPPQGPEARDARARCAPSPGSIPGARSRLAQLALAAVVGAAAFWISTLLWPIPAESGNWLIERYEALSLDPFRKTGYSHRILAPLVAHALGLDGDRFRDFTLAFGPILLAGIFLFCRREGLSAAPAGNGRSRIGKVPWRRGQPSCRRATRRRRGWSRRRVRGWRRWRG